MLLFFCDWNNVSDEFHRKNNEKHKVEKQGNTVIKFKKLKYIRKKLDTAIF